MEKINIALSMAEDNAAAIRELEKKLMRRTTCRLVPGVLSPGRTSFGQVTSDGTVGVIVYFSASTTQPLYFGDEVIVGTKNPIPAVLPAGTAELYLPVRAVGSYAIIFGA